MTPPRQASMALKPGDTLQDGRYHIFGELGRGGFTVVYRAQDTQLDMQVAIKEMVPSDLDAQDLRKHFLREAKLTMRLNHPRLVRTFHVFAEGQNYDQVMEYMAGGSLEDRLGEDGRLPMDEAIPIAAGVCEGLDHAHRSGVVHLDLKPANILFDSGGAVKVADFGIAHASSQAMTQTWVTRTGFVAGTLPYMSPEQTRGVRNDPRIDVYALGAVLYRPQPHSRRRCLPLRGQAPRALGCCRCCWRQAPPCWWWPWW
jgi:serine/threonine-protein kinase